MDRKELEMNNLMKGCRVKNEPHVWGVGVVDGVRRRLSYWPRRGFGFEVKTALRVVVRVLTRSTREGSLSSFYCVRYLCPKRKRERDDEQWRTVVLLPLCDINLDSSVFFII